MDAGKVQGVAEKQREEKRKFLRFPLSVQADCLYNVSELGVRCRIVDMSSHGLGFEFDSPVGLQSGQIILLAINMARQKKSVSAVARLIWDQGRKDGFRPKRMGGRLLFMDSKSKKLLLEQAHAGVLSNLSTRFGRLMN